jgi:glyoxylase-like metal-dependent hydrolase (beta-lactamase superfamily II)
MSPLLRAFVALALLTSAIPAQGQPARRQPFLTDTTANMYKLAEGVFAITHASATSDWPHGNTGVVIGSDGILIIDSNYLPDRAEMDLALIRRVSNLPVRYLVNTHWHGDHTHGNGVYRDSFPGLTIIGPRQSAPFIALNLEKLPKGALKPDSYNRTTLARLEATLSRGTDSAGRTLSAEERTRLTGNVVARRNEIAQLARVKVAPPNLLFDDSIALDLGGRRVEIRDMGRANSPHDVVIYLPDEQVLFTGDILVSPLPYTTGASPAPWIDVLRALERYPVTSLVPGHGPVFSNHDYTTLVRETFEMVRSQVDSMYRAGVPMDRAVAGVDVAQQRLKFLTRDGTPIGTSLWELFTRAVAQPLAECYHGYRC